MKITILSWRYHVLWSEICLVVTLTALLNISRVIPVANSTSEPQTRTQPGFMIYE